MTSSISMVTGANRGIGHALAARMGKRGATTGTYRSDQPAALDGVTWAKLDLADTAAPAALADDLGATPIELLVCNAGVFLDKGQALDAGYDAQLWADTFAVNVTGVFLTIQSLLPNLRAAQAPRIAIISSQMASSERAPGGSYIYRASKAAALNLGRNLATDLAGDGIAVGIYHPGWVQTDMGGATADITVDEAADGLMDRFDDLSMDTTGCFLTWDGRSHPY